MSTPAEARQDRVVDEIIGVLLRTGVLLAASVVLVGGILYLIGFGSSPAHYAVFRGEPSDLRGVASIFRDAAGLDSRGIIQLGLLLLIATPVARVVFAAAGFLLEKDDLYVCVSLIVLAVLLYSLLHAA